MFAALKRTLNKASVQLNITGLVLVLLLGFGVWHMLHPFSWASVIPLIFMGYAAYRVVFELTINRKNVPTMATGFFGRRRMARRLAQDEAETTAQRGDKSYTIVDFGSGRGELTRYLAQHVSNSSVTGLELAKGPHQQALWMQKLLGIKNLEYRCVDFDTYDCRNTNAVVMYLSGRLTSHVGEKLQRELPKGAMVIAHTFPLLGAWEPLEIVDFRTPFHERIYVYRKG